MQTLPLPSSPAPGSRLAAYVASEAVAAFVERQADVERIGRAILARRSVNQLANMAGDIYAAVHVLQLEGLPSAAKIDTAALEDLIGLLCHAHDEREQAELFGVAA